jgi:hypothetical protein
VTLKTDSTISEPFATGSCPANRANLRTHLRVHLYVVIPHVIRRACLLDGLGRLSVLLADTALWRSDPEVTLFRERTESSRRGESLWRA